MTAIRPATVDDLSILAAIDAACFDRPWSREAWHTELVPAVGEGVVLLADDVALACAPIVDGRCELRRIAVCPERSGRGLGGRLLDAILDRAAAAGCPRVELEVAADNEGAIALYRGRGFVVVGRRPRYYRGVDALLMDRALG